MAIMSRLRLRFLIISEISLLGFLVKGFLKKRFVSRFNLACYFVGLKLQGAECAKNKLSLCNTITTDLPDTCLTWKHIVPGETVDETNVVQLPVYLNQTRVELLFTVDITTTGEVPSRSFYERGVAFLSSFLTG